MSKYLLIIISVFLTGAAYPIERHTWNYYEMINCLKTVVIPKGKDGRYHHIGQIYMPCKLLGRDVDNRSILCDDSFDKLNVPKEYNTAYHPFIHKSSCDNDTFKIFNSYEVNQVLFEGD